MADLSVKYLGLSLSNPIVAASCGLTRQADQAKQCEDAGAGAVVLKSLFEEEIQAYIDSESVGVEHTEAVDYIRELETEAGVHAYADNLRKAKEALQIPVIASINAVSRDWWVHHVPTIVDAGADALELNISLLPHDHRLKEEKVLDFYLDTVGLVKKNTKIPIAVKIWHHFTSIPALVDQLHWAGADGVVLFNRFYQLDIDVETFRLKGGSPFSNPSDLSCSLRWISIIYGQTEIDLAASGGVHAGEDVVKTLLAGAQVAQVCSALYRNGVEHLQTMRRDLETWMERHSFSRVDQFRGKLSRKRSDLPESFERLQYIKTLVGQE
ncbi:MAG: dihydroorotate dehydrogenase-like protein [Spirochaetaceae bacterium]|nr:MAG: dihydroorotate dehydrogenase-like protein [Spirochaetaceae bacterium]